MLRPAQQAKKQSAILVFGQSLRIRLAVDARNSLVGGRVLRPKQPPPLAPPAMGWEPAGDFLEDRAQTQTAKLTPMPLAPPVKGWEPGNLSLDVG